MGKPYVCTWRFTRGRLEKCCTDKRIFSKRQRKVSSTAPSLSQQLLFLQILSAFLPGSSRSYWKPHSVCKACVWSQADRWGHRNNACLRNNFQKIPALCLVTLPLWRQLLILGISESIWWHIFWPHPPSCSWACPKKTVNPFFSHSLKAFMGLVPTDTKKSDANERKTVEEDESGALVTRFPCLSFLCGSFLSRNTVCCLWAWGPQLL